MEGYAEAATGLIACETVTVEPVAIADTPDQPTTSAVYRRFGAVEATSSPTYTDWALSISRDPGVIRLIEELPGMKRQPNLVFASARHCGGPIGAYPQLRPWLISHWPQVKSIALTHATQTNEAARCAMLLPLFAAMPGPLALLEVGASAGLCLFPDRYSYRYNNGRKLDPADGASSVLLATDASGPVPIAASMPNVAWRAGIDLCPVDVRNPDAVAWLDDLIWPEHADRRARLQAAVAIARADPPRIVRGSLLNGLEPLASSAPNDATLVVFHSAVLAYLTADQRAEFVETVSNLPGHWISNEGVNVTPGVAEQLTDERPDPGEFILALDGRPVAFAQPHGRNLTWLGVR